VARGKRRQKCGDAELVWWMGRSSTDAYGTGCAQQPSYRSTEILLAFLFSTVRCMCPFLAECARPHQLYD
jgi:hypothetical protein